MTRRRSITETKTFRLKEEKNHINYETQQSMSRGEAKLRLNTAEVAIQVRLRVVDIYKFELLFVAG